jgi:acetyl esterase/lipase
MRMKRIGTIVGAILLARFISSPALAAQPPDAICRNPALAELTRSQPATLEGATSYTYKRVGGSDLRLHVFKPQRPSVRMPAIVFFYGGAWMWGDVTSFLPYARHFSELGIVTVLADYRVYCRHGAGIVDQMADAKSAIRWVRDNARLLQVDPRRIAASGGSAGGHLALSSAMFPEISEEKGRSARSARPDALLLLYPCVDETTPDERGVSEPALTEHGADVSPVFHVSRGLPPTLILQGTGDSILPNVRRYCERASQAGNRCELIEYGGAPHGFVTPRDGDLKWRDRSLADMEEHLRRLGYIAYPATGRER